MLWSTHLEQLDDPFRNVVERIPNHLVQGNGLGGIGLSELDHKLRERHTVKAVLIVNSLPCATYTKKDVIDTRMGPHIQMREKRTELIRAATHCLSVVQL